MFRSVRRLPEDYHSADSKMARVRLASGGIQREGALTRTDHV